jgi:hypothetical protein
MGMIAGALWLASLFTTVSHDMKGWFVLKYGWIAPLAGLMASHDSPFAEFGCFAWYANIPLIIFVIILLSGRRVDFWISTIILCLALTGLAPIPFKDVEIDGHVTWEYLRGPAVWLWLSSFAVVWAVALYAKKDSGVSQ